MREFKINTSDIVEMITVKVRLKGLRVAEFRIWLATKIIILAAFVGGFNMEIESECDD